MMSYASSHVSSYKLSHCPLCAGRRCANTGDMARPTLVAPASESRGRQSLMNVQENSYSFGPFLCAKCRGEQNRNGACLWRQSDWSLTLTEIWLINETYGMLEVTVTRWLNEEWGMLQAEDRPHSFHGPCGVPSCRFPVTYLSCTGTRWQSTINNPTMNTSVWVRWQSPRAEASGDRCFSFCLFQGAGRHLLHEGSLRRSDSLLYHVQQWGHPPAPDAPTAILLPAGGKEDGVAWPEGSVPVAPDPSFKFVPNTDFSSALMPGP